MKQRKKIAIVGTAPSWKSAPFDDSSWDIWACNRTGFKLKRWDVLYEIHRRFEKDDREDQEYLAAIPDVKPPKEIRSLIPLGGPANKIIDRPALFKKYGSIWFSSSFGYMLAGAIEDGATDIGLWGVEMESREEYATQFAGCRHFMDLARFIGIKIETPDRCALLREPVPYPDRFETIQALIYESKATRAQELIKKYEWQLELAKRYAWMLEGTIKERKNTLVYESDPDRLDDDSGVLQDAKCSVTEYEHAVQRLKGQLWMTQQYKRLFVWNAIDPDIGEETEADIEDAGPI